MRKIRLFNLLLCLCIMSLSTIVSAAELSRRVVNQVQVAFELQAQQKIPEAIVQLNKIETQRQYDKAYVQRMLGILYWQNQQLKLAEQALKKAVSFEVLSSQQQVETQRMLADIQLTQAKYQLAIKSYLQVLTLNKQHLILKPKSIQTIWLRVAQSYYQQQHYLSSLSSVDHYFKEGGKLTVRVLNLRLGSQIALKNWSDAIKTTQALKNVEPKNKLWWKQQVSLYLRVNDFSQALATLKQFERSGFTLTQEQYKLLAQLYNQENIPEKAALVYADHINNVKQPIPDNYAIEARYWQDAKNWQQALAAWKQAAVNHDDYRWNYIELLQQQQHYKKAIAELTKLKSSQRKELALVSLYYKTEHIHMALMHAQKANQLKSDKQTRSWLHYLSVINSK